MSEICPDERFSRCVFLEDEQTEDINEPTGDMFMPDFVNSRGIGRYETSVILHDGQGDAQIDAAGLYIEQKRKSHPRYLGRCVCRVGDIEAISQLAIEKQPSKISAFHANILGWSNDCARRMLEAEKIAMRAVYIRRMG